MTAHAYPRLLPLALCALLAACTTVTTAPPTTRLSGDWVLDPAASEDLGAKIDAVVAKQQSKWRQRFGRHAEAGASDDNDPGAGDIESPDGSLRLAPDFKGTSAQLRQELTPASTLSIDVHPDVVLLTPAGLPGREYRPAEVVGRFDEYGSAQIDCNWSGNAFTIRARYSNHGTHTESYTTDADGAQLILAQRLIDQAVGKIDLRSVYRRR